MINEISRTDRIFQSSWKGKKRKKEEFDNLLKEADINLDVMTSTVVTGLKEAKVNQKKQKKKEES